MRTLAYRLLSCLTSSGLLVSSESGATTSPTAPSIITGEGWRAALRRVGAARVGAVRDCAAPPSIARERAAAAWPRRLSLAPQSHRRTATGGIAVAAWRLAHAAVAARPARTRPGGQSPHVAFCCCAMADNASAADVAARQREAALAEAKQARARRADGRNAACALTGPAALASAPGYRQRDRSSGRCGGGHGASDAGGAGPAQPLRRRLRPAPGARTAARSKP